MQAFPFVLSAGLKLWDHRPFAGLNRGMEGQAGAHAALLPVGRYHDDLANLSQGPGRSPDAGGGDSVVVHYQYLHVSPRVLVPVTPNHRYWATRNILSAG